MVAGQIMLIEAFLFICCWNMISPGDVSDENFILQSRKGIPYEY